MKPTLLTALAGLACSAPALAQTPLVVEGDHLPGIGNVTRIDYVDVNSSGNWIVEADTDHIDPLMSGVVIVDGTVMFQEGTSIGLSAPAGATYDFADVSDVNDNGDLMFLLKIKLSAGTVSSEALYWNGMLLLERDVTPINAVGVPPGSIWASIAEVWQNSSNQIMVGGRTNNSEDILILLTHDGAGTIVSETLLTMDGITMPGHNAPVTGLSLTKTRHAMNDAGDFLWYVDDDNTTIGGTPNDNICCDSWIYRGLSPLLNENDPVPGFVGADYSHFSTAELDLNEAGDWIGNFVLDGVPSDQNTAIFLNGSTLLVQEGDEPAGLTGSGFKITSFGITPVQLADNGDYIYYADWDDPDTDKDTGIIINDTLVLQEGVSMIGADVIDSFNSGSDSFEMSDNGAFVIFECTLVNGIEGAYLIDRNTSVGTNYCVAGANSVDAGGALISASGSNSLAAADLVLNAAPVPNQPGLFYYGPNQQSLAFGNGFRCVGGTTVRMPVTLAIGGEFDFPVDFGIHGANFASMGTVDFQCWYRDPAGGGASFNLSDGLEVVFQP